jgi:hypothetical protein
MHAASFYKGLAINGFRLTGALSNGIVYYICQS